MEQTKFVTKILLSETLKQMPINGVLKIKSRTSKPSTVHSVATRLKRRGFLFQVSERGMVDECVVTRLR